MRKIPGGWQPIRLTNCDCPDFAPDGAAFGDEEFFLSWISGCAGELRARWSIINLIGIGEQKMNSPRDISIRIHPNPFNDIVNIEWRNESRHVHILDISGKAVSSLEGNGLVKWNAAAYPSGVYFVRIEGYHDGRVVHLR